MKDSTNIGLVSYGLYLPAEFESAAETARRSGLSKEEIRGRIGLARKPKPGPEDHPGPMALKAAQSALAQAEGIDPGQIDVVIWTGEEYKDYVAQTASIRLQEELEAHQAWAFDLVGQGVTPLVGLRMARDLMRADPDISIVLLAGGTRNVDLVDPTNPDTEFLLPCSASGAAVLLKRGSAKNLLQSVTMSCDAKMADEVSVPVGGTQLPFSEETIDSRQMFYQAEHPALLSAYLAKELPSRLVQEVRRHHGGRPPDYLALRFLPPATREAVLNELGLLSGQSLPLDQWGHHGGHDVFISLGAGLESGAVHDGSVVVLAAAGIGFNYAAASIRWGPAEE